MSQSTMTIHEAANRLGVCASTLRTWGEKTGVAGNRTSSGKRLYSDDDLSVLEAVKDLRDQDAGWTTIRKRIGREAPVAIAEPAHAPVLTSTPLMHEPEGGQPAPATAPQGQGHGQEGPNQLVSKVIETLNAQSGMAERYARAGYQIGRLEAEVKHLAEERERMAQRLAESEQKLAELSLNEELLRAERARLGRELGEARQRLAAQDINPPSAMERAAGFVKKWW